VGKAGAATAARKAIAADTAGRPNAAGATNAAGPATRAGRFDTQVRDDFFAGFLGDAARLDRAMTRCEEVLAGNAGDAVALVWHGAGLFFRSGEAFRSGDRARGIELATRGQAEMDRAVAIAPDSVAVRIPRGSALLAATRFMAAGPQAVALLEKGLSDYEHAFQLQAGHLDKLSGHSRGELLFGLGEGWLRAGDPARARPWFERLAAMPDAGHHQQARDWLDSGKLTGGTSCVGCHTGK
jgi:hypothetical protein